METKEASLEDDRDQIKNEPSDQEHYVHSLDAFTIWLLGRLFEPEWEIRHGAATSLREVIKKLVNALFGLNTKNEQVCMSWFEMCMSRLLKVIALDRFADYIGDEVVAPVRETCTQIIGIISKLYTLSLNDTNRLCLLVNRFLKTTATRDAARSTSSMMSAEEVNDWEIRHSGIMILKYMIAAALASNAKNRTAASTDALKTILALTFDNVLDCIRDNDDDVRQMASSSLEPVSKQLNQLLENDAQKLENLMRILIDVLSELDDLGKLCNLVFELEQHLVLIS